MQCDTVQYTDSPQRIDIEVDGEEEGQGCADSTVGLSKNMLGLQGWVNDIRLHYISGVGISGITWVGVPVSVAIQSRRKHTCLAVRIAGISKSDRIVLGGASYLGDVRDEFHLGVG